MYRVLVTLLSERQHRDKPKAGIAKSMASMSATIESKTAEYIKSFDSPLASAKAPNRKGVPLLIEALSTNPKRLSHVAYFCEKRAVSEEDVSMALGLVTSAADTITSFIFAARSSNTTAWQLATSIIEALHNLKKCKLLEEQFFSADVPMSKPSLCKAIAKKTKLKHLSLCFDPISDLDLIQLPDSIRHLTLVFDQSIDSVIGQLKFLDQVAGNLTSIHLGKCCSVIKVSLADLYNSLSSGTRRWKASHSEQSL